MACRAICPSTRASLLLSNPVALHLVPERVQFLLSFGVLDVVQVDLLGFDEDLVVERGVVGEDRSFEFLARFFGL